MKLWTSCGYLYKQGLQRRLHSAPRVKRETSIVPVLVSAFRPEFYRNGVIPCQNVDTVRQVGDRATTFNVFVDIYAKNVKFRYQNPILGKLRVTHDLG